MICFQPLILNRTAAVAPGLRLAGTETGRRRFRRRWRFLVREIRKKRYGTKMDSELALGDRLGHGELNIAIYSAKREQWLLVMSNDGSKATS